MIQKDRNKGVIMSNLKKIDGIHVEYLITEQQIKRINSQFEFYPDCGMICEVKKNRGYLQFSGDFLPERYTSGNIVMQLVEEDDGSIIVEDAEVLHGAGFLGKDFAKFLVEYVLKNNSMLFEDTNNIKKKLEIISNEVIKKFWHRLSRVSKEESLNNRLSNLIEDLR